MSRAQLLNKLEDLDWLFSTHLKNQQWLKDKVKSFIICGNEDAPEFVELYSTVEVILGQEPILRLDSSEMSLLGGKR